jgi:outer membrane lipoprotein carrier protein
LDDNSGCHENGMPFFLQSTRYAAFWRQTFVNRFVARCLWGCALLALPAFAVPQDLTNLLKIIESRYNRTQSLKLDFSETYAGTGRPAQIESGVLYLRKPGRMRWEYASPAGKVFLSDGKEVIQYTPADPQAIRSKLKESEDMRAPLAFLLGKLDFAKEFKSFQTNVDSSGTWIVAEPKSENLAYSKVEFLAGADGEIHRVRVTGQDQSKLDFAFSHEQLNAPVSAAMFTFHAPAGVQIVEEGQ